MQIPIASSARAELIRNFLPAKSLVIYLLLIPIQGRPEFVKVQGEAGKNVFAGELLGFLQNFGGAVGTVDVHLL